MFGRGKNGGNPSAIHARQTAQLERSRRKNSSGIAQRHKRVGFPIVDQLNRPDNGGVLLSADRGGGLVFHGENLAGMDDPNAMVTKPARGQGGMDLIPAADQEQCRYARVSFQRAQSPLDHDTTAVVATHHIHRYAHNLVAGDEPTGQAPAVTVRTWRPL